jgi:hypothetical protein
MLQGLTARKKGKANHLNPKLDAESCLCGWPIDDREILSPPQVAICAHRNISMYKFHHYQICLLLQFSLDYG